MRIITRTGVTLSIVAALVLYGVQLVAALGVALGIIVTGALAGLGVAKWLQRDWYGRQFSAGARAGAIACGVGGLSSLLYLLGQGPRSLPDLAARSHLLGVDMTPLITALAPLGWTGVDVAVIAGAMLVGVLIAALVAQIAGWSKSRRALRVVAQARLAAQALQHGEPRAGATAGPRASATGPQLFATGSPAPLHEASDWDGLGLPGASYPAAPAPQRSWRPASPAPQPLATPAPASRPATVHRPSDARSAQEALTDEERLALSAWEEELDEFDSEPGFSDFNGLDEADGDDESASPTEKKRAPNHSAFLTSPPPVKPAKGKSKRKRGDTGDWLC